MACAKKFNVKIYVTSTKFNLIKESKLEAHSDNKKTSILADDPIIDADFSDVDFDD